MKKFLIIISLVIFSFANEVATKDDIKELRKDIKENNRLLLEVIRSSQESTNKRFEDMQKYMDKRFGDMQKYMNKRFEFMQNLMMGLLASIFGAIGYMFWDRRKTIEEAEEKYSKKLDTKLIEKADKKTLEKIITIIEELAKKDNIVKEILEKHNLKVMRS